jgi:hypothetical protein
MQFLGDNDFKIILITFALQCANEHQITSFDDKVTDFRRCVHKLAFVS